MKKVERIAGCGIWRIIAAAVGAMIVASCSNPVGDAEDRLAIVENVGSAQEKCRAHRALAEAHLQAKHEREYYEANVAAGITCMTADNEARYGPRPTDDAVADNLETEVDR